MFIPTKSLPDDFRCTTCGQREPQKDGREFVVYCAYLPCAKGFHVDCNARLKSKDPSKSDPNKLWVCSNECQTAFQAKQTPTPNSATGGNESKKNSPTSSAKQFSFDPTYLEKRMSNLEALSKNFPTNASLESKLADFKRDITNVIRDAIQGLAVTKLKTEPTASTQQNPSLTGTKPKLFINNANKSHESILDSDEEQNEESTQIPPSPPTATLQHASLKYRANIIARLETPPEELATAAEIARLNETRKYLTAPNEFDGDARSWLVFETEFYRHWDVGRFPPEDMLSKLRKWLKGKALEHVRGYLNGATSDPDTVMEQLRRHFFRPKQMIARCHKDILELPQMKNGDRDAAVRVLQAVAAFINMHNQLGISLTAQVDEEVESLLSSEAMREWQHHLHSSLDAYGNPTRDNWKSFHKILEKHIESLAHSTHGRSSYTEKKKGFCGAINGKRSNEKHDNSARRCLYDDCPVGKIYFCASFLSLSVAQRRQWASEKKLCFRCFRDKDHLSENCVGKIPQCRAKNCRYPNDHSSVMHLPDAAASQLN